MKKVVWLLSFFFLIGLVCAGNSLAAMVTVNPKGDLVWQVLGDESNLTVKSIAQNVTPPTNTLISLKTNDGRVELNGMDVTNLKETLVEVQARGDTNEIKIGHDNGKFTVEESGIVATTEYPIVIDPAKNKLSVTTSTGDRLIAVLPYEAVLSLERGKFVNEVKDNQISLRENANGELLYEVTGVRNVNLFNLTTVKANVGLIVSATTGEILKVDQPEWLKIFGFLFS